MVDHLVLGERLVVLTLDVGAGPRDRPLLGSLGYFAEAVVLKRESDQILVRPIVEPEEVTSVFRPQRPLVHLLRKRSEYHVLFLGGVLALNCPAQLLGLLAV